MAKAVQHKMQFQVSLSRSSRNRVISLEPFLTSCIHHFDQAVKEEHDRLQPEYISSEAQLKQLRNDNDQLVSAWGMYSPLPPLISTSFMYPIYS